MLITAIKGGQTVTDANGIPSVIGGEPCYMDTDELRLNAFVIDNDNERTEVTEYWDGDNLVHRSVAMHLKTGLFGDGLQGSFS